MTNRGLQELVSIRPGSDIVIAPLRGWGHLDLRELWDYRDLIWSFATRNFRVRYRQMALGPLWSILSPVIDMILFSTIFGGLAKLPSEGVPYAIFAYSALIPWTYFAGVAHATSGSLVSEMDVISKIYFPRLVLPLSNVLALLFDMGISLLLLLGMTAVFRFTLTWRLLFLPAYLALAAGAGLAIGLWLATLAVRFRDVRNLAQYGLQVLKFLTPVVYSAALVPAQWQTLYRLNPVYWVVEGFRWMFLGIGQGPHLMVILPVLGVAVLLMGGVVVFRRTERTIVDWL